MIQAQPQSRDSTLDEIDGDKQIVLDFFSFFIASFSIRVAELNSKCN